LVALVAVCGGRRALGGLSSTSAYMPGRSMLSLVVDVGDDLDGAGHRVDGRLDALDDLGLAGEASTR
jgi:hypothetical protein